MLRIVISEQEYFDESANNGNGRFFVEPEVTLELEHSLVSLAAWEAEFEKPFLSDVPKTNEETLYYVKCMCRNSDVDISTIKRLNDSHMQQINNYISRPMTATWFNDDDLPKTKNEQAITAELIYYWMASLNIWLECENWNLKRLITLIKVCNVQNQPPKKLSKAQLAARHRELNKINRAKLNTTG